MAPCNIQRRDSQRCGKPAGLVDRALCIQFCSDIGTAHKVRGDACILQWLQQVASRLLPCADHDRVHRQGLRLAFDADVQAFLVHAEIFHAAEHASTPRALNARGVNGLIGAFSFDGATDSG